MLEPGWVTDNHDRSTFSMCTSASNAITPDNLRQVVWWKSERHNNRCLTVHDLRNPHHSDPAAHDKQQTTFSHAPKTLIT